MWGTCYLKGNALSVPGNDIYHAEGAPLCMAIDNNLNIDNWSL